MDDITEEDVKRGIKMMSSGTAVGIDQWSPGHWKHFSPEAIEAITHLFRYPRLRQQPATALGSVFREPKSGFIALVLCGGSDDDYFVCMCVLMMLMDMYIFFRFKFVGACKHRRVWRVQYERLLFDATLAR